MTDRDRSEASERTAGDDAVGGEHDRGAVGHLVELVDEDRAALLQVGHHPGVVHDLLAHVDRRAAQLERALDDLDRPLHPGAERPRPGQQHRPLPAGGGPALGDRGGRAQRAERGHPAGDHAGAEAAVGDRPDDGHRVSGGGGGEGRRVDGVRARADSAADVRLTRVRSPHEALDGGHDGGRLHVGGEVAVRSQPGPFGGADDLFDLDDAPRAGVQARPAQLGREQVGAGERDGGLAVGHLGGDDQVARAEVGCQPGRGAHHNHRSERTGLALARPTSSIGWRPCRCAGRGWSAG